MALSDFAYNITKHQSDSSEKDISTQVVWYSIKLSLWRAVVASGPVRLSRDSVLQSFTYCFPTDYPAFCASLVSNVCAVLQILYHVWVIFLVTFLTCSLSPGACSPSNILLYLADVSLSSPSLYLLSLLYSCLLYMILCTEGFHLNSTH